jgi:putative hemolysin
MTEIVVILLLVAINGMLAGSEMAIVSARPARLSKLAESGSGAARAVLQLRATPERFLATVQIGITLIGAVAGAFGGATLAQRLAPAIRVVPWLEPAADEIAFGVVVALITYLSVVFGELVPKSLALRIAEPYALLVARPLRFLAALGRPLVFVFAASSNLVLKLFGDQTSFMEGKLSRDDLEALLHEARTAGSVDAPTGLLMARTLEFATLRVDDVMVHRRAVVAISENAGDAELRDALLVRGHRRVPVFRSGIDDIVGYVLREDVLAKVWAREPLDVKQLLRTPFFMPEVMPAAKALEEMRTRKQPLAIVLEEHGGMGGIVTIEDLVEELVGDIFHEQDATPPDAIRQEQPGVFLALGNTDVRAVEEKLGIRLPDWSLSRTLGGLVVELADGRLPAVGERFVSGRCELEAVEVSPRRVRQVRLRVQPQQNA